MLARISDFFNTLLDVEDEKVHTAISLEIACAVLLCEVMRADGEFAENEKSLLHKLMLAHFSLTAEEIEEITSQAMLFSEQATDFYQFTSKINSHYTIEERIEIVRLLWKMAYADGELSSIEEHTIRRIGDLLHLRHGEYIQTKPQF